MTSTRAPAARARLGFEQLDLFESVGDHRRDTFALKFHGISIQPLHEIAEGATCRPAGLASMKRESCRPRRRVSDFDELARQARYIRRVALYAGPCLLIDGYSPKLRGHRAFSEGGPQRISYSTRCTRSRASKASCTGSISVVGPAEDVSSRWSWAPRSPRAICCSWARARPAGLPIVRASTQPHRRVADQVAGMACCWMGPARQACRGQLLVAVGDAF